MPGILVRYARKIVDPDSRKCETCGGRIEPGGPYWRFQTTKYGLIRSSTDGTEVKGPITLYTYYHEFHKPEWRKDYHYRAGDAEVVQELHGWQWTYDELRDGMRQKLEDAGIKKNGYQLHETIEMSHLRLNILAGNLHKRLREYRQEKGRTNKLIYRRLIKTWDTVERQSDALKKLLPLLKYHRVEFDRAALLLEAYLNNMPKVI